MGRQAKERLPQALPPVEKVSLDGKHMGLRIGAFILCLAVGVGALTFGVSQWLSAEPGWTTVSVTVEEKSCGGEFTLNYLLGQNGRDPTQELRSVRAAYNQIAVRAYRLFTTAEGFDDPDDLGVSHNLYYLNSHPNEEVAVDPALYLVLEQAEAQGSRALYLGPLYSVYNDLFFCQTDGEARELDPFQSQEIQTFCQELAGFARQPEHVQVELLGENRVRLRVSEEYRAYAEGVDRACYVDLGWLRTAFLADYMAEELAARGLDSGMLSSYDGCTRTLGLPIGQQVFSLYDWAGDRAVTAAQTAFDSPVNAVSLRTFPLNQRDEGRCYVFEDGGLRHWFIDPKDGLCRAAVDSLALYSQELGCGQLALEAESLLIADRLDRAALGRLRQKGIQALAAEDRVVLFTQAELPLTGLYEQNEEVYHTEYIGE